MKIKREMTSVCKVKRKQMEGTTHITRHREERRKQNDLKNTINSRDSWFRNNGATSTLNVPAKGG